MARRQTAGWAAVLALLAAVGAARAEEPLRPIGLQLETGLDPLDRVLYFVPNDPLYVAGWQWHLNGTPNVNIVPAWTNGYTGAGVTIGIVDDSLQTTHPDLAPNYVAADSYDFGQGDGVPDPVYANDNHGTAVAGVAAAAGGNGVGVSGAAPSAGLAGLRIDFPNQTEAMFVNATLYHSSGDNTNIQIKNHSYGIIVPFIPKVNEVTALQTSTAAGTIHCFAAGNERAYHGYYIDVNGNGSFTPDVDYAVDGDANKKAFPNAQESIAVAALADDGQYASYSNWGANIFCTAPSNGGTNGIATTDRTGGNGYNSGADPIGDTNYTSTFGGTSSASPLVAGILALAKEAQPNLNVRMAKHLLAQTCTKVDATDADWITNGAGYHFNRNYGFGLIDANALTQAATIWPAVTALVTETTGLISVGQAITGSGGNLVNFTLNNPGGLPLEEIEIYLDITHTWRGDLEAFLTSPMGTSYQLMEDNPADSFDTIDWTFLSNVFWGEDPAGQWALQIFDTYPAADNGIWNNYSVLAKTGMLTPEPGSLALLAVGLAAFAARRRK
jgi:subtilisin family serine protease